MRTPLVHDFARRLLTIPTAPYYEADVAREVRQIAQEHQLSCEHDEFGNLLLEFNRNPQQRPIILAAHMDHPGFLIRDQKGPKVWIAEFMGSVGDPWLRPGIPLILLPDRIPAFLGDRAQPELREFFVTSEIESEHSPRFGVWDLPEFEHKDNHIVGRACDDLIGCAAVLGALVELQQQNAEVNVTGALSRAEEVGFHGALCLAQSGRISKDALVISIETSRELPPARMGEGVIVRTGDKSSIFNPEATRFLTEVATDLQKRDKEFKFQRALMSGGTCEGTAYQEFGCQTAAVCIALGNYHNCADSNTIAAEFVHDLDLLQMVALLAETARAMSRYSELVGRLPQRLQSYAQDARRKLAAHPLEHS